MDPISKFNINKLKFIIKNIYSIKLFNLCVIKIVLNKKIKTFF